MRKQKVVEEVPHYELKPGQTAEMIGGVLTIWNAPREETLQFVAETLATMLAMDDSTPEEILEEYQLIKGEE